MAWIASKRPSFSVRYLREVLAPYLEQEFRLEDVSEQNALSACSLAIVHFDDTADVEQLASLVGSVPTFVWVHDVLTQNAPYDDSASSHLLSLSRAQAVACAHRRNVSELLQLSQQLGIELPANRSLLPYPVSSEFSVATTNARGIAFAGQPALEARAHQVLDILSSSNDDLELHWLLEPEQVGEAELMCAEFGVEKVKFYSPKSAQTWRSILSKTDIAVHTHYSAYGDPGPLLGCSMMAGKLCVVSDFSSSASLPDCSVKKLRHGIGEKDELSKVLLAEQDVLTSRKARQYAQEEFSLEKIAAELLSELKYMPAERV